MYHNDGYKYSFVQTHRTHNTQSELLLKFQILVDNDASLEFMDCTQMPLNVDVDNGGGLE